MGTIVCQSCGSIITHFESNQVKTLYSVAGCRCSKTEQEDEE
ncbi:GapA-binding peptide SR1P [Brevibacillus humidisoli]|nr:GapA-binding peptide SR1P [Brevibacillus humidisoli]UFJ41862.1 GapA-binding peptide SR1P [Brevibacillus humidisoli]